jgi:hypothetical protein
MELHHPLTPKHNAQLIHLFFHTALAILHAADHPTATEFPPGFDWAAGVGRVRALKPACDRVAGRIFDLDDNVQDASFFADIALHAPSQLRNVIDTVFGLRFSCYGNLFTQLGPTGPERVPEVVAKQVIHLAVAEGFVFVPAQILEEPYTGENKIFLSENWWYRFFEYL